MKRPSGIALVHALGVATMLAPCAMLARLLFVEGLSAGSGALTGTALERSLEMAVNTGTSVIVAIVVALCAGFTLAAAAARGGRVSAGLTAAFLVLAAGLPLHVVADAWISLVPDRLAEGSALVLGLIHGLAYAPIAALVLAFGLHDLRDASEEAAATAGAGALQRLFSVALPRSRTAFFAAGALTGIWTGAEFGAADRLLVRTYAEETYTQFALTGSAVAPLIACAPFVLAAGLAATILVGRLAQVRRGSTRHAPLADHSAPWRAWQGLAVVVSATLALLPVLRLLTHLGPDREAFTWIREFVPELSATSVAALGTGLLCALLAPGLATSIVRRDRTARLLVVLIALLLAIPAPLIGIGWATLFSHLLPYTSIVDGQLALIPPLLSRFLPVAILILLPSVSSRPEAYDELPELLGAPPTWRWWHARWLPSARTATCAGFITTILVLGELPLSILCSPPGITTISARTFSLLHYGLDGRAAILCLLTIALLLPLGLGLALLLFRGQDID